MKSYCLVKRPYQIKVLLWVLTMQSYDAKLKSERHRLWDTETNNRCSQHPARPSSSSSTSINHILLYSLV